MPVPPLFAEAAGRETVTFTVPLTRGQKRVRVEAVADPMTLGSDVVHQMATEGVGVLPLLTDTGALNWTIAMPQAQDIDPLCVEWAKAAGLGEYGFGQFVHIVRNLELVEADLQRFYNLDLGAWPRREITTRRVVTLMAGLVHEYASLFWSEMNDRDPLSKEATVLAQLASGPGDPHEFLVSRELRRQREQDAEKIARMRRRGLAS